MVTIPRLALAGLLALAACAPAPSGDIPDPHRFGELIPGVATTDDAVRMLGPPQSYSSLAQGTLLQWLDVYARSPIHVSILFGADGRMVRVAHVFSQ